MKKTVHLVLGALLRCLWIGAILIPVMAFTILISLVMEWTSDQGAAIWMAEIAVAILVWLLCTLHDVTGEKEV